MARSGRRTNGGFRLDQQPIRSLDRDWLHALPHPARRSIFGAVAVTHRTEAATPLECDATRLPTKAFVPRPSGGSRLTWRRSDRRGSGVGHGQLGCGGGASGPALHSQLVDSPRARSALHLATGVLPAIAPERLAHGRLGPRARCDESGGRSSSRGCLCPIAEASRPRQNRREHAARSEKQVSGSRLSGPPALSRSF